MCLCVRCALHTPNKHTNTQPYTVLWSVSNYSTTYTIPVCTMFFTIRSINKNGVRKNPVQDPVQVRKRGLCRGIYTVYSLQHYAHYTHTTPITIWKKKRDIYLGRRCVVLNSLSNHHSPPFWCAIGTWDMGLVRYSGSLRVQLCLIFPPSQSQFIYLRKVM